MSDSTVPVTADAQQRAEELAEILRQRLLSGVYLGSINSGMRLPSLRQLAREYSADVKLVRRAYQLLEREGLVELRNRSGVFFAPAAERARAPLSPRAQWLINVAAEALGRAIPVPELGKRISTYTDASDLRVACIECNDDQATALCRELTRAFGVKSGPREIDQLLKSRHPDRDLADVDLLVTTPFHAGEVEELAARIGKPWLSMTTRSDIFAEIAGQLALGPVYYAVSDKRFAKKLLKIFRNMEFCERLIPLQVREADLSSVPATCPLYITQLAREVVGSALPAHTRPSVCVFAPVANRAMLSFIVSRNIARDEPRR
ncbi:MAG: winged helix-turn-helix domain-containing protein [bacterium]